MPTIRRPFAQRLNRMDHQATRARCPLFARGVLRQGLHHLPSRTVVRAAEQRVGVRAQVDDARFVRSALSVFADHVRLHLQRGPCRVDTPPFLPVPAAPVRSVGPDGDVRRVRAVQTGRTR